MTASPIQGDAILWDALRTRRRRRDPMRGMDAMAYRWISRIKHSKINLNYLRSEAETVVAANDQWAALSDRALDAKIASLREVFARRKQTREQVRDAFAAVREAAYRETGEKPFMVQIMGALGMYHGQIVEMVTGEGKTLTASVASSVLGWLRRPVHVITVNDYLAQRDADGKGPIYRRCGLRAAAIVGETPDAERIGVYRQPIVYSTQKELVADWLRDQLRLGTIADPVSTRWMIEVQRAGSGGRAQGPRVLVPGLHVVIVDEADAVLIDEAVTPLIIAQPREEEAQAGIYERARDLANELDMGDDFTIDLAKRRAKLTAKGRQKILGMLGEEEHAIWRATRRREELVEQSLVAKYCYHHKQHYQIVEDRIVIVDEYTGRFMQDRQWEHGLHQAVEAKHHLKVTADRDTLASMSFQRFFRQYKLLAGMTGTAADAKAELETTYGAPVRVIPTNRPIQRQRLDDLIYVNAQDKWHAVVEEIIQMRDSGRAVLVGTRSIDASELVSEMLNVRGVQHQVLNAVHHAAEADIVEGAGSPGAVTVATNMAGRGTDIKLDPRVRQAGGLHVILTERHTASRIDRQLMGRAGRQGDPGSARVIVSLEDELIVKFASVKGKQVRRMFGNRSEPLPRWVAKVFDMAQNNAQRRAFSSRLSVMQHDEDLDKHLPR